MTDTIDPSADSKACTASNDAIEMSYRADFVRYLRVAIAICGTEDLAYEAVQDAFAAALRSLDTFRGDGSLDAWLWAAVVNAARNRRRSRDRWWRRREELTDHPAPERAEPHDGQVRRAVAELSERQRSVVFLRYYGGLEYREIGQVLGISVGTVGATLTQAHQALRTRLANEGDGGDE